MSDKAVFLRDPRSVYGPEPLPCVITDQVGRPTEERAIGFADHKSREVSCFSADNARVTVTMTSEYTDVGREIAALDDSNLIGRMLKELAPYMDRSRPVVIDGFYDTESGDPAIMAKIRTTVEDARKVLARIDDFRAGDWWWENRKSASFDLILSVGA